MLGGHQLFAVQYVLLLLSRTSAAATEVLAWGADFADAASAALGEITANNTYFAD